MRRIDRRLEEMGQAKEQKRHVDERLRRREASMLIFLSVESI